MPYMHSCPLNLINQAQGLHRETISLRYRLSATRSAWKRPSANIIQVWSLASLVDKRVIYNDNTIILLSNQVWFSVVCTLVDGDARRHSGQNVVDSQGTAKWAHNKFWSLWWCVSLLMRVRSTQNHNSICFLPQYHRQRKCFFRARAEKGIVWNIDASSVVWTLINNGKLANQIARLVAIVVKRMFSKSNTDTYSVLNVTCTRGQCA